MGGYSGNALRFGLMDIRPIEVTEIVKRFGLKFRRTVRGYESLKPSKSYEDLILFKNETIFNTITLPDWFEADKLVDMYSKRSIEHYNKDTELKEEVERMKDSGRTGRPLLSFLLFYKDRCEKKRDYYLDVEADRFLRSNLPLSFYNKFVVFDNTFYAALDIMIKIVRIYESRAAVARNVLVRRKCIEKMQYKLGPIIDELDNCDIVYSRLKHYVSIWNSETYEQSINPDYLDFNKLDLLEYEDQYNDYKMKLRECRRLLLYYDSEYLRTKTMMDEFAQSIFGNLLTIPSSSLKLEG